MLVFHLLLPPFQFPLFLVALHCQVTFRALPAETNNQAIGSMVLGS